MCFYLLWSLLVAKQLRSWRAGSQDYMSFQKCIMTPCLPSIQTGNSCASLNPAGIISLKRSLLSYCNSSHYHANSASLYFFPRRLIYTDLIRGSLPLFTYHLQSQIIFSSYLHLKVGISDISNYLFGLFSCLFVEKNFMYSVWLHYMQI